MKSAVLCALALTVSGCAAVEPSPRELFIANTKCNAGYEPVYEPPITGCWPVLPEKEPARPAPEQ